MRRIEVTRAQLRVALNVVLGVEVGDDDELRVGLPAGGGYDTDVVLVVYADAAPKARTP